MRSLSVVLLAPCGSDRFRTGANVSDPIDDPLCLPANDSVLDDSAEKLPFALSKDGLAKLESVVARLRGPASPPLASSSFFCDSMEK